jgi:hypothetical protein
VQICCVSFKQALALALLSLIEWSQCWACPNPLRRLLEEGLTMLGEIALGDRNDLALG